MKFTALGSHTPSTVLLCFLLTGLGVARAATDTARFNLAVDRANKAIQAGRFADAEKQIDAA